MIIYANIDYLKKRGHVFDQLKCTHCRKVFDNEKYFKFGYSDNITKKIIPVCEFCNDKIKNTNNDRYDFTE